MEGSHEYKSYGEQWKEDFTAHGFRKNVGSIIPSGADLKDQGKICYNVICKGPYHIGKFIFTKHE